MNHWKTANLNLTNLQALLTAISGDDIGIALIDDLTGEAGWVFLDDAPTPLLAASVTGNDLTAGNWTADDVTFPDVPDGDTAVAALVYRDTGTPSTSPIVLVIERYADTTFLTVRTNGGDITLTWPGGLVATI